MKIGRESPFAITHDLRSSPKQIVLLLYSLVKHNCHKHQEPSSCSDCFACRIITKTKKFEHITPPLREIKLLLLNEHLHYRDTVMTFRYMKGLAPTYLCESLRRRKSFHYHNTRNRESLDIPPSKTKSGQRRFLHRAVNIWNNLDKDFKQLSLTFKKKVENAHAKELF